MCDYHGCITKHIIKTHIEKYHGPEAWMEWKAHDWKNHDWNSHEFKEVKIKNNIIVSYALIKLKP